MKFYAHTAKDMPEDQWQPLTTHLNNVTKSAAEKAAAFQAEEHARLAGLFHDLGKAQADFLAHLRNQKTKVVHASHGAALALGEPNDKTRNGNWPVAFAINGHHAGLHNRDKLQAQTRKYLEKAKVAVETLSTPDADWGNQQWPLPKEVFASTLPDWLDKLPFNTPEQRAAKLRAVDFFTRFLFSTLIDADRLDTEAFDPETKANFAKRHGWRFCLSPDSDGPSRALATPGAPAALLAQLNKHIKRKREEAGKRADPTVCAVRDEVLRQCCEKAKQERGVFALTVPTGGGKTLASLAFALEHAAHHATERRRQVNPDGATASFEITDRPIRRVIIVIPYLSIIQQTALELRKVFGDLVWKKDAVDPLTGKKGKHPDTGEEGAWVENDDPAHKPLILEHHSQAQDPPLDDRKVAEGKESDYSRKRTLRQLAAENWDAPVVVTTSVQFFDSLFSRRTADARKLHNIAQSVIIFDEVQTFPPRLMQPILDVLGELTNPQRPYGCSLVLCTATQPALGYDEADLRWGLSNWQQVAAGAWKRENVREIIDESEFKRRFQNRTSFQLLKRTEYHWPDQPVSWQTLAGEVLTEAPQTQALVVVNTRRHARELFEALRRQIVGSPESRERPEHLFHLSTWMTPAHRMAVLEKVRERLDARQPCLLVSTQCIEAGVDVDFPAVWRAFGPYDAIAQAAGRCNRNGALKDQQNNPVPGRVRIFRPENDGLPTGVYHTATSQTELLRKMAAANPHDPASFATYFRLLYQLSVPDECEIQRDREQLRFETVSERFQFIEAYAAPLLIAAEHLPGADSDQPICIEVNGQKVKLADFIGGARHKGYFTPAEWQLLQPHIVNLDIRDRKTLPFLQRNAKLVFSGDDKMRGLYVLNASLYEGGLNGCGLDVLNQDLSNLTIL